ncbi:MAG: T9SS type A sorting domain-containing protein [Ignavibacteria bacterium]
MKTLLKITLLFLLIANVSKAEDDDKISNKIGAFAAKIKGGEVELNWKIINPSNLYKFKIEGKKSGTELYNSLTDVLFSNFRKKEESDSLSLFYYTYSDRPHENGVYFYKLSLYDLYNKVVESEEIKIGITEVPEFNLHQNNPNPFNPSTVITYQLLVSAEVKLKVYSLTGQVVDILVDAFQTPGKYSIDFNANKYSEMSSGIYFYKLETNYTSDIRKMIFTK